MSRSSIVLPNKESRITEAPFSAQVPVDSANIVAPCVLVMRHLEAFAQTTQPAEPGKGTRQRCGTASNSKRGADGSRQEQYSICTDSTKWRWWDST